MGGSDVPNRGLTARLDLREEQFGLLLEQLHPRPVRAATRHLRLQEESGWDWASWVADPDLSVVVNLRGSSVLKDDRLLVEGDIPPPYSLSMIDPASVSVYVQGSINVESHGQEEIVGMDKHKASFLLTAPKLIRALRQPTWKPAVRCGPTFTDYLSTGAALVMHTRYRSG